MAIDNIEKEYGIVNQIDGCWQVHHITCPGCHTPAALEVEIDLEQQGSLAGHYYTCENCLASFKAAYTVEVNITLELIPNGLHIKT